MKIGKTVVSLGVTLALLTGVKQARANDSGIDGYGGRWKLLSGEHHSVQMVAERVTLDVFDRDYTVRADFIFRNTGPARQVKMGFPEQAYGDVSHLARTGAFKNFVTTVDGKPLVARRTPVAANADSGDFSTYWVKTVPFGRDQTRHVTVSYRAPLGSSVARGIESFAVYAFTGGNWKGKVQRSDLTVHLREPGTWAVASSLGNKPLNMARQGATFTYTFRNWQAQEDFEIAFSRVPPHWLMTKGAQDGPFADAPSQTVTVPGRVKGGDASTQYSPPALWKEGRVWVRLSTLNDALAERYPSKPHPGGGVDLSVYLTGNARTNEAILQTPPFDVTFQEGRQTLKVRDNTIKQTHTVTLPEAPWALTTLQGKTLYVPAGVVAALWGGKVLSDPAHHTFEMRFPLPVRR